jgi:hypothetical protein
MRPEHRSAVRGFLTASKRHSAAVTFRQNNGLDVPGANPTAAAVKFLDGAIWSRERPERFLAAG